MTISQTAWNKYITKLAKINQKAADKMQEYISKHGFDDMNAVLDYAFALAQRYGKATGALACQMYDTIASMQGASVPSATMAELATMDEVASAVYGARKLSDVTVPSAVARLVKLVGADTMLHNAVRDNAEFAWIPSGDTCAFCIALASRGWQRATKKAIGGDHATHIHAHCNCEYAIRFDSQSNVKGYNVDKYKDMYYGADGGNSTAKMKALRREVYERDKDLINTQHREAYARRMLKIQEQS